MTSAILVLEYPPTGQGVKSKLLVGFCSVVYVLLSYAVIYSILEQLQQILIH